MCQNVLDMWTIGQNQLVFDAWVVCKALELGKGLGQLRPWMNVWKDTFDEEATENMAICTV